MRGALAVLVTVEGGGARTVAAAVGLDRWLGHVAPAGARGSVGIAILTDLRMRRLNFQYRKKDAATDVLSFPNTDRAVRRDGKAGLTTFARAAAVRRSFTRSRKTRLYKPPDGFWGDIAIAAGVAARQARTEGHSLAVELRVLALHGLLHLLGYDHEVDKGLMGRVEERLRRRGGLPSGLAARGGRPSQAAPNQRR